MPEKDVTFSAVWKEDANHNGKPDDEEDKFDIRYTTVEAEGVSGMPADVTDVLPGTQQTVSSASPVRDGYVFAGWTTGDVSVTDGVFTMPEKDVTFSAVWQQEENPSSSESSSSESSSGDGSDVSSEEPSSNPDAESEDESEPIIDVPDVSTPLAGPSEGDGTAEGGSAPEEGGASSGSGQPNTGNSSRAIPLFFGMMAASIAIAFAALLALKRKTN